MKPNLYTYSLKRGYETVSEGITYNQLKKELTEKFKITWEPHFELNYRYWFFQNFFEEKAEATIKLAEYGREHTRIKINVDRRLSFESQINNLVFLKGESCLKYLDYEELNQARRSSRWAFFFSVISILIALTTIFLTQAIPTKVQQPLDVKIIEQVNTRVNK